MTVVDGKGVPDAQLQLSNHDPSNLSGGSRKLSLLGNNMIEASGLSAVRQVFANGGFGRGIGTTLGIVGSSAEAGVVTLRGAPDEDHYNPLGSVHGGYISTMLDAAMALAVQTTLEMGTAYSTTDLHVHFVRSLTLEAGGVTAVGRVLDQTRGRAVAEAEVRDQSGTLYARATAGFAIARSERRPGTT